MIDLPNVFNGGFKGDLVESELRRAALKKDRMHQVPFSLEDWNPGELRRKIFEAMGGEPDHSLPLDMEITRTIDRGSYRILCLSYVSRPGVRVTGNLYVPAGEGPFPAVINMHGHWSQGRLAARVQMRGHILAQLGYVVLAVDAFGSGERSPEHGVYSYHGGVQGGSLFQIGESLMGFQVIDNMRGVDLLCSLPYVKKERIGACGASGGGNQTMWLAAMDERITAAVPVVSVGSFQSYVLCSNCMCELLPGGLEIANEAEVLSLVAPRAIMPVNGVLDDNAAFNPGETRRTVDEARRIFRAYGVPGNIRQMVTEEHHFFSSDVVKALVGWFDLHLKCMGDGEAAETLPDWTPLPEEEMMVYPRGKRPSDVISMPEYLKKRETELLEKAVFDRELLCDILALEDISVKETSRFSPKGIWERIGIEGSDGRLTPLLLHLPDDPEKEIVIVGTALSKLYLSGNPMIEALLSSGCGVAVVDLWGGGENNLRFSNDNDNYYSRSLMWLGKTLQGKWVEDFRMVEKFLKALLGKDVKIAAAGIRDSAIAAAFFAALRSEETDLHLMEPPLSFGYDPDGNGKYSQAVIIPRIFSCCDMPELLKRAGGEVSFYDLKGKK
ncbi:MAG: acetylxylan esterase [Lentisphaeria bacterium]|nr:acetylxylan esterase [Lentisphaeria bacterium]